MPKRGGKLVIPKYIHRKGGIDAKGATDKWKELRKAISHIYGENASSLSFQVLYTNAYHIVLHKHGEILYSGVNNTISEYIKTVQARVLKIHESTFLKDLLTEWDKHRKAILMIRDILMYMDRNYVPQHKKKPVYDLGVEIFGSHVLFRHPKVLPKVQKLMLQMILRERNNEATPDRFIMKALTNMMLEIGKKEVYEPCFEKKFLDESSDYYHTEAQLYFADSTAPQYLRKVQDRLDEELERASRCFDEGTKAKIILAVKEQMIQQYVNKLITKESTGVKIMLQQWQIENLKLVYHVCGLVEKGLDPAVQFLQDFCKQQGLDLVNDEDKNEKPIDLIHSLILMYAKYQDLLEYSFSDQKTEKKDPRFVETVKNAFEDIVNNNDRFPEYLSLYIDSKLKKGKNQIPEHEYDALFEEVISLFRHLKEKDVFEKYYKSHLSKRLLSGRSASDEAEKSFISKLKSEFGYQFTSKLEGMFADMATTDDLMRKYRAHLEKKRLKTEVDLSVQVLTTGFWPITQTTKCNLPKKLSTLSDIFKKFYLQDHSGRRLAYQFNMGTADIKTRGYLKHYELNVSTFQMCIILLYNKEEKYSFGDILKATNIPISDLKKNLLSFCARSRSHMALMKKEGDPKVLDKNTVFSLNRKFTSKLVRVKINPVILVETKEERKETVQKIHEDRKWLIDAAVVRIMKARKHEIHRNLVIEVTKQLSSRFFPSPDSIKRRIESLIEREYMERGDKRDHYIYL